MFKANNPITEPVYEITDFDESVRTYPLFTLLEKLITRFPIQDCMHPACHEILREELGFKTLASGGEPGKSTLDIKQCLWILNDIKASIRDADMVKNLSGPLRE